MKRNPYPLESPELWVITRNFGYAMKQDRVFIIREGQFGVGPRTLWGSNFHYTGGPKFRWFSRPSKTIRWKYLLLVCAMLFTWLHGRISSDTGNQMADATSPLTT